MASLVAGIDSSTQSCKVVVRDAETGRLVREGRAAHPDGSQVHPDAWERALRTASEQAGGLADVAAVAAQIGFLSGVFERSAFRVMAKGGEKAARIIATATRDRFDLSPARLATLPGEPKGAFAVVEVLALP